MWSIRVYIGRLGARSPEFGATLSQFGATFEAPNIDPKNWHPPKKDPYDYGLLWLIYGLLSVIRAYCFGLLGFLGETWKLGISIRV